MSSHTTFYIPAVHSVNFSFSVTSNPFAFTIGIFIRLNNDNLIDSIFRERFDILIVQMLHVLYLDRG